MKTIHSKTILFITGAFVSHHCWDGWKAFFESKGYATHAPAWPHKNASAKELRDRQPDDVALATLTTVELIDYHVNYGKSLPEKPIIIGHSFGGLIAQVLINRNVGAAGVFIHSAPPMGVFPYEFSFLRSGWKVLGLFTSLEETYLMSFKDWQYAFVNGLPLNEQRASYEELIIPESKTAARGALTDATKVDFNKSHVPILFTAGGKDHIIPAHLNRRNVAKYKKNGSVLEYKEYPNHNHLVLGLADWRLTATDILNWIESH